MTCLLVGAPHWYVSEAGLLTKSSHLVAALGVTKFLTVIAMNLVAICFAAQARLRCSTNPPL